LTINECRLVAKRALQSFIRQSSIWIDRTIENISPHARCSVRYAASATIQGAAELPNILLVLSDDHSASAGRSLPGAEICLCRARRAWRGSAFEYGGVRSRPRRHRSKVQADQQCALAASLLAGRLRRRCVLERASADARRREARRAAGQAVFLNDTSDVQSSTTSNMILTSLTTSPESPRPLASSGSSRQRSRNG